MEYAFLMYTNLGQWLSPAAAAAADDDDDDETAHSYSQQSSVVNSVIISIATSTSLNDRINLTEPISFTLSHIRVCLRSLFHCWQWRLKGRVYTLADPQGGTGGTSPPRQSHNVAASTGRLQNIKLLLVSGGFAPWPPTSGFSIGNHLSRTHETPIFMSNSVKFCQVLGSKLSCQCCNKYRVWVLK